ncbi:MAG: hypothetical protein ABJF65_00140 [Reichenbachiella sp.]|uniref:hypothetical protein n=1 Tax=Reichenbachiella sp. TaxID=2184521 RepID=UPI0032660FD2
MRLRDIETEVEIGDILTLKEIDGDKTEKDKVISVFNSDNPDPHDWYFHIRTEKFDYDFQNFFEVLSIEKSN